MAFQGQSIEEIYNEINNRQIWVERLALVNFDDEEYKVLLRISKEIIRQYDGWWSSRQQQARKVFLAFANEYTRRKLYIQDKFWDEFLATLHTDMKQYGLITKQLLWETFQEENVTRKKTGKYREFVLSLYKEVDASKATSKECVEFFHWYYKCGDFSEVTPEIIANYHVLTGHSLAIHEKAVEALNKDCQILTKIIDYAIE